MPNGHTAPREWIKHPGAAAVVPILPNGDIILVKQFRYPVNKVTIEIPAGKLDVEGEDPVGCAHRELSEETGYTASTVKHLISFYPTCGYSNEYLHIYLCRDLTRGEKHWDKDECIEILEYTPDELIDLIMKGEIEDSKTIIGILFARQAGEI